MEAFFVSTGMVALAEIGDKIWPLAFILTVAFQKPIPIFLAFLMQP
jgi:putative Ca2+/H+ antiporter (TMEM165/GDT1 family)